MANALNKNLQVGDVIVANRESVRPEYTDLRMVVRIETYGAFAFTSGSKIGVSWIEDKIEDVWYGDLLDKEASEKAQAEIVDDPQYGWLFKIIRQMQIERKLQERTIRLLRAELEEVRKPIRTRVVAVYVDVLSDQNKFGTRVLRTDGSIRTYHISRHLHDWLYSNLTSDRQSAMWFVQRAGEVRLYP